MKARTLVLAIGVGCAACTPDDQRTESLDPAARERTAAGVQAQLDSGNAAFRAGDLAAAQAHYRRATEIDPDAASAWFGLYMVAERTGATDSAQRWLARARDVAPGATLIHPTRGDSAR